MTVKEWLDKNGMEASVKDKVVTFKKAKREGRRPMLVVDLRESGLRPLADDELIAEALGEAVGTIDMVENGAHDPDDPPTGRDKRLSKSTRRFLSPEEIEEVLGLDDLP